MSPPLKRGERGARWFVRRWLEIGGKFEFFRNDEDKEELGQWLPAPDSEHYNEARDIALFGFAYPGCFRIAARIVREEGLAVTGGAHGVAGGAHVG